MIAKEKDVRDQLPELFCLDILKTPTYGKKPPRPLLQDLSGLKKPHGFPINPEDGIEWVRLCMLRLMPFDAPGARVVLETLSHARKPIGS